MEPFRVGLTLENNLHLIFFKTRLMKNTTSSREYTYPVLTKFVMLFIFAIMLALILICARQNYIAGMLIGVLFGSISLFTFFKMTGKISVTSNGLVYTRPLREEVRLKWKEIDSISSDWTDTTFTLKGTADERIISFNLMLNNLHLLVDDILTHRHDLFTSDHAQELSAGRLRWAQILVFGLLFPLLLSIIVFSNEPESSTKALLFLAFLCMVLVNFIFTQPFKITFSHDRLVVKYAFHQREVMRDSIVNVILTTVVGRHIPYLLVRVLFQEPADGKDKVLNLAGLSHGSSYLYGAIQTWMDSGRKP